MHRTKCSGLIKNVIGPSLKNEMIGDLKSKNFALSIDEATDVSVHKTLCMVVRYVSDTKNAIATRLLGLSAIEGGTGSGLYGRISSELSTSIKSSSSKICQIEKLRSFPQHIECCSCSQSCTGPWRPGSRGC